MAQNVSVFTSQSSFTCLDSFLYLFVISTSFFITALYYFLTLLILFISLTKSYNQEFSKELCFFLLENGITLTFEYQICLLLLGSHCFWVRKLDIQECYLNYYIFHKFDILLKLNLNGSCIWGLSFLSTKLENCWTHLFSG